jgi:hypothetical protein
MRDPGHPTRTTDPSAYSDGFLCDPGRRFPLILTPAAYQALTHLASEEKRVGSELLRVKMADIPGVEQPPEHAAVQIRNPSMMFQHDPELFKREMDDYDRMSKLVMGLDSTEIMHATDKGGLRVADPEIRGRHGAAMLMVTKIAYDVQDEWTLRLMSTFPGWTLTKEQFCLLGKPESVVWNEEQRLILRYTHGVVHRAVSDELFSDAKAAWGIQQLLRYTQWITYYVRLLTWNAVNMTDAERNGRSAGPTVVQGWQMTRSEAAVTQGATAHLPPAPGVIQHAGRRFPTIISAEGFDSLAHLSDREKAIGVRIFNKTKMTNIEGVEQPPEHAAIQAINPWMIFQSDPELMARDIEDLEILTKLVIGMTYDEMMAATDEKGLPAINPDAAHRYYSIMLMVAIIAHEYGDEWTTRLMATTPGWTLSKQQFCLLGQPKSAVWDDEHRLIIEYTQGVFRRNVSDALFARALEHWGTKQLLRYTAWVTKYIDMLMINYVNVSDADRKGERT